MDTMSDNLQIPPVDTQRSYDERKAIADEALRQLLDPQTDREARVTEWLSEWDLYTTDTLLGMLRRLGNGPR